MMRNVLVDEGRNKIIAVVVTFFHVDLDAGVVGETFRPKLLLQERIVRSLERITEIWSICSQQCPLEHHTQTRGAGAEGDRHGY